MITVWGDRRDGTWEIATAEADFSPLVVYQFSYTLPEKPWWWSFIDWLPFISLWEGWAADPRWLRDGIVKAIAAKTEIPEDEIKVLWFAYNSDTNKFQIQIKYVPPTPAAIAGAGIPISILVVIGIIAIPVSLFLLGKIVENLAPDTIEKLVEEVRKGISWITILAGIVVTGSLVPLLIPKRKKT